MSEVMYKVTWTEDDKNLSFIAGVWTASKTSAAFVLSYEVDKWTIPTTGKIMVFKTLADAFCFVRHNCHQAEKSVKVWKCECKNPRKLHVVAETPFQFEDFWKNEGESTVFGFCRWAPKGTYAASAVRLIEQVWPVKDSGKCQN